MGKGVVVGGVSIMCAAAIAASVYFVGGFGEEKKPVYDDPPTPSYVQSEKYTTYRKPYQSVDSTMSVSEEKAEEKEETKTEPKEVAENVNTSAAAVHTDTGAVVCPQPGDIIDAETLNALGGPDAIFSAQEIPDDVFARMKGKSFRDDCTIPREDLRYLKMLYVNAEGQTLVGEMVVASSVADEVLDIFRQLYDAKWPIKKMVLVDNYDADDDASCADGNTAAFNYREVTGGSGLSNHAYGLAIDINTFENPYVIPENDYVFPAEAVRFMDRSLQEPYMIHEGDLCWRLFTEHGWSWGGSWATPIDYQHFEKV